MARLTIEKNARTHLAVFLGLAFVTALLREPEAGFGATVVAVGGWALLLTTIYRGAMADHHAPGTDRDATWRQVVPTLIGAVFWLFGWFFGVIALGLAWKYKSALDKAPEHVRQHGAFARLFSLLNAGSPQGGDTGSGRAASVDLGALFSVDRQATKGDPWEALEAAEKEAKKAIVREVEPAPQMSTAVDEAPVTAPVLADPVPAFAESVVAAAEAPGLPPLPDLFARSSTEPVGSSTASTDPLSEFKNPSSGFDDVLAMLQGKPSSGGEGSNS